MTNLRYHQYWLKCSDCNRESRFPVYEHDGYMIMRNPLNKSDCRLINWKDKAFKEVGDLVKKIEKKLIFELVENPLHRKIIINSVPFEQKCFSQICDLSNGIRYIINADPVCPYCFSRNIEGWGPTENPYETIDVEFPHITHDYWDGLDQLEKEKIIYNEIVRLIREKQNDLHSRNIL